MNEWLKYMVVAVLLGMNSLVFAQSDTNDSLVETECVDFPDKEAEFPGGMKALQEYISKTIEYPDEANDITSQGRIYIKFVINEDGSTSNIMLVKGISQELDREVKRIITNMPKWNPAVHLGKNVKMKVLIPITICLN